MISRRLTSYLGILAAGSSLSAAVLAADSGQVPLTRSVEYWVASNAPAKAKPLPAAPSKLIQKPAANKIEATIAFPVSAERIAVFTRNDTLWLVAEGDAKNIEPAISGPRAAEIGKPKEVGSDGVVAFRMKLPPQLSASAARMGGKWEISLSKPLDKPVEPDKSEVINEGGRASLSLNVPDLGAPIDLTDPDVGDTLVVIPASSHAYGTTRSFAEFEIVGAVLGAVIRPIADQVAVSASSGHVTIAAPRGLALSVAPPPAQPVPGSQPNAGPDSQEAPTLAAEPAITAKDSRILLDWAGWHLPSADSVKLRHEIEHRAALVKESERPPFMIDLARLALSEGHAPEALGYIDFALRTDPDLEAKDDVRMLRGAALALTGRTADADNDLTKAGIEGTTDSALWRGLTEAQSGNWKTALEGFRAGLERVQDYPDPLYRPLVLSLIEAAIRGGDIAIAKLMVEQLRQRPGAASRSSAALYYFDGRIAEVAGDSAKALAAWKKVTDGRNQYYRTRAELATIQLELKTKAIDAKAAVERLDRLRFAWRGDDFELEVLDTLGHAAEDAGDYETALRTWRLAQAVAGTGPIADNARARSAGLFRKLFIDGGADSMPPLRALGLFDAMHDQAPPGPDGDKALDRLAERMVQMDLLAQGADILDGKLDRETDAEAKAKSAARIAALRLLDGKPELALRALDASDSQALSTDLKNSRRLLRASALSKAGRVDEALALLGTDTGASADELRADIGWASGRWKMTADALGRLMGTMPAAEKLDESKAELLLRRIVALNLAEDTATVARLRRDFTPAMAGTKFAGQFEILTRPAGTGTLEGLDAIRSQIAEVDLFKQFLSGYRTGSGGA